VAIESSYLFNMFTFHSLLRHGKLPVKIGTFLAISYYK